MNNPGRALRIRRKHLGLRIEVVAAMADISAAYLYLMESGKYRNPSLRVARRIAACLGVSVDLLWPPETKE